MPFLVVGGITVPVAVNGAVKKAPERIGTSERAFAGNLRTAIRAEKRAWQATTKPLSNTDAASIETAITLGAHVSCSGDLLGATVTCQVTASDGPYHATGASFKRVLVLTLREV